MNKPQSNENFYYDENGLLVFTGEFLLKQGSCCGNGCRHCPYNFENVPEKLRKQLLEARKSENKS